MNPDGSLVYTHDGSETTGDSFTYRADDGLATSDPATVTITVTPVNDAPVVTGDSYTVLEGGTMAEPAPGVLGNDSDPEGDPFVAILVSTVSHGTLAISGDGSFLYVHDGSETSTDSFTYRATDGLATSDLATVVITVENVNDAPVAVDDDYTAFTGVTLSVPPGVLENDTDADGDPLMAILVSDARNGTLIFSDDGSFSYTPDPGFEGTDLFAYVAHDVTEQSEVAFVGINVILAADLDVIKEDGPDPVTVGRQLTYTLTVTNNGPSTATGVTLTDTLPQGVEFTSATPSQGTCIGTIVVTCDLGNLAVGESSDVSIVVTVNQEGALVNTATVSANEADPDASNNLAVESTTVGPPLLAGDVNADGAVDVADLLLMLFNYGVPTDARTDINHDGHVDIRDMAVLGANFGLEPEA